MTETERLLDDGVRSISDAYKREHKARENLAKMLEIAETKSAKLQELVLDYDKTLTSVVGENASTLLAEPLLTALRSRMWSLGIEPPNE